MKEDKTSTIVTIATYIVIFLFVILSISLTKSTKKLENEIRDTRDSIEVLKLYNNTLRNRVDNCRDSIMLQSYQLDILNKEITKYHGL